MNQVLKLRLPGWFVWVGPGLRTRHHNEVITLLFSLLICLLCGGAARAQQVDNRLTTTAEAVMDVPADQAILLVSLSYSDEKDASLVYELHQLNQQKLAGILKELKIADTDIVYTQLMTRRERDFMIIGSGGATQERIKSVQQVFITISNLKQFPAVQRRLVSDGFTDVTVNFRLSNQQELENQLLLKAIGRAREKADLMAKAVSRTVKRVVRLGDTDELEGISLRTLLSGAAGLNQPRYAMPPSQATQLIRLASQVKLVVELE